jgi:predicted PurR-regulated permease PerM
VVSGTALVPRWLARLGWSGWLVTGTLAGAAATVAATGILLPLATPVILALLLAAVLQPVVSWLRRHGVARSLAAALGALAVPAALVVLIGIVLHALRGQGTEWQQTAQAAAERLRSGVGADPVTPLADASKHGELLLGFAGWVVDETVVAIGLLLGVLLAVYVLFFLLKDGARFADGVVGRVRLPPATTRRMLDDAGDRLRQYFVGTTVVAAMDAVVITVGAAALRLPLLLVIALVTFTAAYVPYLGAWLSAIFAVVVALGSGGLDAALWMLLIVLVTQNLLEGVVRPFVFGSALDMHPLTVLAATVLGGLVGGVLGVFVGPPFVAIAISWLRLVRSTPVPGEVPQTRSG